MNKPTQTPFLPVSFAAFIQAPKVPSTFSIINISALPFNNFHCVLVCFPVPASTQASSLLPSFGHLQLGQSYTCTSITGSPRCRNETARCCVLSTSPVFHLEFKS